MNPVQRLHDLGQSVWLDHLDHHLVNSGELDRMIDQDGLRGLTSNPTIFHKAISASDDYDDVVRRAALKASNQKVFEEIELRDIALASDRFRPLYEQTAGRDGYVSMELSPALAHDMPGSIAEARRHWGQLSRPNVLIKIPGTREGLGAIEECLAEGININITLLFSVERYKEVTEAYLRALERRAELSQPIDRLFSVASFFVSRIDTKIDKLLDAMIQIGGSVGERARRQRGRTAITNAKAAYDEYRRILTSNRWKGLAAIGALPQRILWASTSPKDVTYRALHYVESLVARDTIDTMTPATFRAFLAEGRPEPSLEQEPERADGVAELGIDLKRVTEQLEEEGIAAFRKSFDQAVAVVAEKRAFGQAFPTNPRAES